MRLGSIAVMAGLLSIMASPAWGLEPFSIELQPLASLLLQALAGVVMAALVWVFAVIRQRLNIDMDETTRKYVLDAIKRTVDTAVTFGEQQLRSADILRISTDHALLANISNTVIRSVPGGLARLGVGPAQLIVLVKKELAGKLDRQREHEYWTDANDEDFKRGRH